MKYPSLTAAAALALAVVTFASAQAQPRHKGPQKVLDQRRRNCCGGPVNRNKGNTNRGKNNQPGTTVPNTRRPPVNPGKPPVNTGKPPMNSGNPNFGLEPGENKKTQKNPVYHEAQKKSNQTLIHAFHVLQATRLLLQKGDHDYGGHRLKALKAISVAQGELRTALGKYGKKIPPAPPGKSGPGKEAQKTSNAQLKHALGQIQATTTQLANANYDYWGHRYKAVVALEGAARELQLGLRTAK